MQERVVVLLAAVLAAATTFAGLGVTFVRPTPPQEWHSFDLAVSADSRATVGGELLLSVGLRRGLLDPASLWIAFLSLDVGDLAVLSATPGTNPWGYPTVWNVTGLDLSATIRFLVTVVPADAGYHHVHAMVWTPHGDLGSVAIEPNGYLNPANVDVLEVASLTIEVA